MISQVTFTLHLTQVEVQELEAIRPWEGNQWENPPNNTIREIVNRIRAHLNASQITCCYCGLKLRGTSNGEIEHIAAKASFRHPEFTFHPMNLAVACHFCNSPEKKGTKETISLKTDNYETCEFLLVHPYLDNPDNHYEWTDNTCEVLIQIRNGSEKARFSIEMFQLDSPIMNELRASQIRMEELKRLQPLSAPDNQLLEQTLEYKMQ